MDKRSWVCGVVVAMAALVMGFFVHGVLLRADYLALSALYRTQAEASANAGWILAAYASLGFAMTWLYLQLPDRSGGKGMHGVRFGLAVALVSFVPWHLLAYVGQPLPAALTVKQIVLDVVAMLLLGLLLAWLDPRRSALREPRTPRD
jgi:hypothetical protein